MSHARNWVIWMQGSMSNKIGKIHVHVVTPNVTHDFKNSYPANHKWEIHKLYTKMKVNVSNFITKNFKLKGCIIIISQKKWPRVSNVHTCQEINYQLKSSQ
jgi:hypothetical protein